LRVATRSITLDELVATVCERIGIKGRAIVWSHAEACMDVDKPHQLELLRADLEKEQRKALAKAKRAMKAKAASVRKPARATTSRAKTVKVRTASKPKTTTKTRNTAKTKTTSKAKSKKK